MASLTCGPFQAIIFARSPLLAKQFRYTSNDAEKVEVPYDAEVVKSFLHYVYCDQLVAKSKNLNKLAAMAEACGVNRLRALCLAKQGVIRQEEVPEPEFEVELAQLFNSQKFSDVVFTYVLSPRPSG